MMKANGTILIVDDEQVMRDMLQKILSRDGYRLISVENGVVALGVLMEEAVDIVISDVQMPRMDGFELLKTIKQDYPGVGVIMMTAFGDSYTVKDALLLGADEYITKPFKSFDISMVVERAFWRLQAATGKGTQQTSQRSST